MPGNVREQWVTCPNCNGVWLAGSRPTPSMMTLLRKQWEDKQTNPVPIEDDKEPGPDKLPGPYYVKMAPFKCVIMNPEHIVNFRVTNSDDDSTT